MTINSDIFSLPYELEYSAYSERRQLCGHIQHHLSPGDKNNFNSKIHFLHSTVDMY